MDKEKIKDLINKYEQGESSLLEEQIIFDHIEDIAQPSQAWYQFVQSNRKKAPHGLKDAIWESIDRKRKANLRWKLGLTIILAILIVLLSIFLNKPADKVQSDKSKEALLKEAFCMFEKENPKTKMKSIYEDDMIVIYASIE